MDLENIFMVYEGIKDDLKFITGSDVKAKIIIALKGQQKNLSNLKIDINVTSSTILHNMKQLEKKKIVKKEFQDYSLSQTGEIIVSNITGMINAACMVKKNKEYWLNHEINSIPEDLINKLECLGDIEVLKQKSRFDVFKKSMIKSKSVKWIYNDSTNEKILLETILDVKKSLNLISTEHFLSEVLRIKNENPGKSFKNIRLWQYNKDLKLNLIVLDNSIFLNLPHVNVYNDNRFYLISECEKGVKWGNDLFYHYLNQSEEIK